MKQAHGTNEARHNVLMEARRIHIKGLVQGVGFRPFVYRLAMDHDIKGWVENRNDGVIIHAEGRSSQIDAFIKAIPGQAPVASNIFSSSEQASTFSDYPKFFIRKSENTSEEVTEVSPDIAVCKECLADLKTQEHRINYPFINCTNCGPRFTIIRDLPYDRDKTTMDPFVMCRVCRQEYEDILDRRFHAQPVACTTCGPTYELLHQGHAYNTFSEVLHLSSELIGQGHILALKGLGGFHLACDACNELTVSELRKRKNRDGKPFAVMFRDLDALKESLLVDAEEEKQLTSWRRPVILLKNKTGGKKLAYDVSVGLHTTGAMLPYMPFHYQLFEKLSLDVIVLTSGNISDEPIIIDNDQAVRHLAPLTGSFILYNRDIHNRVDDSVQMVVSGRNRMIRRSRGYVPNPVNLDLDVEGILAAGAELVNCFCLGKGQQGIMSQHIGDLKNIETLDFYSESIDRFLHLFRMSPSLVVHDLHPDYLSTRYAREMYENNRGDGLEIMAVQHHHAHIASCMAEHGLDEKVIGISMDGVGYGDDGNIWGGEFFICDLEDYERVTHFENQPMPGGDKATKQPWRMGISYLYRYYKKDLTKLDLDFIKALPEQDVALVMAAIEKGINCPMTSSAGRLFDAIAALCNICRTASFHAEAPMRLESIIEHGIVEAYDFMVDGPVRLEKTIKGVVEDLLAGVSTGIISAKFHNTVINIIFAVASMIREKSGLDKIILSGGSFQNRYILEKTEILLNNSGFKVYTHSNIPSNDGGIALGQLAIAAKRRALRK